MRAYSGHHLISGVGEKYDGGGEEGCGDSQERGERRSLVSPLHSLRSSTSQHLVPAFLVHFAGGERCGDGDDV